MTDRPKRSFLDISAGNVFDEQRRIEVLLLHKPGLVNIVLIFENFPVWLWGLEPNRIGHLHVSMDMKAVC
jgi:hypothetical protein